MWDVKMEIEEADARQIDTFILIMRDVKDGIRYDIEDGALVLY